MKNFLPLILVSILFSCKKADIEKESKSTGLTPELIAKLEAKYPGMKITKNSTHYSNASFSESEPTQEEIDSLKRFADASFMASEILDLEYSGPVVFRGTEKGKKEKDKDKDKNGDDLEISKLATCTNGSYKATGISSGGLFSSFVFTFSNSNSQVSNVGLSLSGVTFNWSWSTGQTYSSGLSGSTVGTATYNWGAFSISLTYTLHWTIDQGNCSMSYYWS
jgi:hypothetical protein